MQCVRAACPAEALHAFGNGAAGDEHDLSSFLAQARDLFRPAGQCAVVETEAGIGHQPAADLDDQRRAFLMTESMLAMSCRLVAVQSFCGAVLRACGAAAMCSITA
jgi:hypothetical protein